MRKTCFAVMMLLCLAVPSFGGTALGIQAGTTPSFSHEDRLETLAVTMKFDAIPFVFAANIDFNDWHVCGGGLTADMWLANPVIGKSVIHWFYGPGFAVSFFPKITAAGREQSRHLFVGPRFVGGINFFLTDFLEFCTQAAIEPGVSFDAEDGFAFGVHLPFSIGFRMWF